MNLLTEEETDYDSQERLITIDDIKKRNLDNINSNQRNGHIRKNNYTQNFKMFGFLSKLLIPLMLSLFLQFIYFTVLYPKSTRIANLMQVYILGIEIWNSFVLLGQSMMSTIIWNNTALVWDTNSLNVFNSHLSYIESEVMLNLTHTFDYDLGNFTDEYRNMIIKVRKFTNPKGNSCQTVYFLEEHKYCYKYFNGLFNSNMYSSLKGIIESFKNVIFNWESARISVSKMKELMYMPEIIHFLHFFSNIMSYQYYAFTVGASNTIMLELSKNLEFVNIYSSIFEYTFLLIYLLAALLLIRPIQRIMENYYNIFYVIPFELFEMNIAIRQKIKKIPYVSKFFQL